MDSNMFSFEPLTHSNDSSFHHRVSWEHFLKTDPDAEGPQQSNDTRNSV